MPFLSFSYIFFRGVYVFQEVLVMLVKSDQNRMFQILRNFEHLEKTQVFKTIFDKSVDVILEDVFLSRRINYCLMLKYQFNF